MVDDVFDFGFVVGAPVVANGVDVAETVVIDGENGIFAIAGVMVAADDVVAPVVVRAHVNVVVIDGGDAPEVAGDGVAAQLGFHVGRIAVDADAAAAVHRVGFGVVVNEKIVGDERTDDHALLVVAVTVVLDFVTFKQDFGAACSHQVGDGYAARHAVVVALDDVVDNADGVFCTWAEINLRQVLVGDNIVIKVAIHDGRRAVDIDA